VTTHRDLIVDQFTKQAVPFSMAPGIRDEHGLACLIEAAGAGARDNVLDVACGPGLVVAAFARVVRHATGVDVTPAMLARARAVAREQGTANVAWVAGDVAALPWADGTFDVVTSRFAFHHLEDPRGVLAEMARVCRPGGRVVVMDLLASADATKAAAMNRMEKLRDPSHVRALAEAELEALFPAVGLPAPRRTSWRLEAEVEGVLARSFPNPGDADRIRQVFRDAIPGDALGLEVRRDGERIRFTYPVAILAAAAR
jgi:SAM-dependent methyltransferase